MSQYMYMHLGYSVGTDMPLSPLSEATAECCFKRNPFTPELLKWALPSLKFDKSFTANREISQNIKQNDKQYRSHLALHCLQSLFYGQ